VQIVMSVWGGRGESGCLRVDLSAEGGEVALDYEARDYYDGAGHHEQVAGDAFRTAEELDAVDRDALFDRILRDLRARGGTMDYWARTLRPEDVKWP